MSVTLTRQEIIDGLTDVVLLLRKAGQPGEIQLIGGAAISLTIDSARPATKDIDAWATPPEALRAAADAVGRRRGWPDGWLDENAAMFVPSGLGRGAEWVTLFDKDGVRIQVASPRMLLAMKLIALTKRPRRDADDVAVLLTVCEVTTADEAERILEEFFPGDGLPQRTYELVEALLAQGPRDVDVPERPAFD